MNKNCKKCLGDNSEAFFFEVIFTLNKNKMHGDDIEVI